MELIWGPPGADRIQVGTMLAPWTLLSGKVSMNACPLPRGHQGLSKNAQKWLKNQRPGSGSNLAECDPKLIKPDKSHKMFIHQIWIQSDHWSVYECVETAWQIRNQETVRIQWSVNKSKSGLGCPIMNLPTKFELSVISGLSANVQKPQKCDTQTKEQANWQAIIMSPSNSTDGDNYKTYLTQKCWYYNNTD